MATVRKRILPSGRVTWNAAYTDGSGARRTKQFAKKALGRRGSSKPATTLRAASTRPAVYHLR